MASTRCVLHGSRCTVTVIHFHTLRTVPIDQPTSEIGRQPQNMEHPSCPMHGEVCELSIVVVHMPNTIPLSQWQQEQDNRIYVKNIFFFFLFISRKFTFVLSFVKLQNSLKGLTFFPPGACWEYESFLTRQVIFKAKYFVFGLYFHSHNSCLLIKIPFLKIYYHENVACSPISCYRNYLSLWLGDKKSICKMWYFLHNMWCLLLSN